MPAARASCSIPRMRSMPGVSRLCTAWRTGLAQDRWEGEFETGLEDMLDRIAVFVGR